MNHLEKYEDFAYHSELTEEGMDLKKKREDEEKLLGMNKCYKCKSQRKPMYEPSARRIERLI